MMTYNFHVNLACDICKDPNALLEVQEDQPRAAWSIIRARGWIVNKAEHTAACPTCAQIHNARKMLTGKSRCPAVL